MNLLKNIALLVAIAFAVFFSTLFYGVLAIGGVLIIAVDELYKLYKGKVS